MNRILFLIVPMGIALASACDHDRAYVATPHVATWEFMQSVGGIAIGSGSRRRSMIPPGCCQSRVMSAG
jgi:hypothetical protein